MLFLYFKILCSLLDLCMWSSIKMNFSVVIDSVRKQPGLYL